MKQEEEARKLAEEKERKLQRVTLAIQDKFGKNAMLKGMNLLEGGTTIGGHMPRLHYVVISIRRCEEKSTNVGDTRNNYVERH